MVNLSQFYLMHMGSVTILPRSPYIRNQFQDQVGEGQDCYEVFPNPCKCMAWHGITIILILFYIDNNFTVVRAVFSWFKNPL